MFDSQYKGKKVLLTGHTGFKGSWLAAWLKMLGADVCGVALAPETVPAHWNLLDLDVKSVICDIRDRKNLQKIFEEFQPETVFHLAAQPIVLKSYEIPAETFEINVTGTANILECCRRTPSVRAIVAVTSDKCYENREQTAGYKESDPMGGYDPYSASKGCCELVINSWRRSFFNNDDYGKKHHTLLASGRAGNVIGGGDWAENRLIPDIVRAAAEKKAVLIRNPRSTRPWQHVLEPLSGYLQLGAELLKGNTKAAEAWNFGPDGSGMIDVGTAAKKMQEYWEDIELNFGTPPDQPHEAGLLHLNCEKAAKELQWHGVLSADEMFGFTAKWYKEFYLNNRTVSFEQLEKYLTMAEERNLKWTE